MADPSKYIAVGTEIASPHTDEEPEIEWEKVLKSLAPTKVLVMKCYTDHARDSDKNVLIYRPAYGSFASVEYCMFAQIHLVGKDCELLSEENIGDLVELPETNRYLHWIGDSYAIFDEKAIADPTPDDTQHVKPYVVQL